MPVTKHSYNNGDIIRHDDNDSNSNSEATIKNKKGYRSHHTDYKPFLRYIESHKDINDLTVQRIEAKLGKLKSNNVNNGNAKNAMPSATEPNPDGSFDAFPQQSSAAAIAKQTKKDKADDRHADLHANYKTKDFTDNDKIFLMKREIDSLRGTIKAQRQQQQQSAAAIGGGGGAFGGGGVPLLSVFLFFGVALVAARTLKRKLWRMRATDALLAAAELDTGGDDERRNYDYALNRTGGGSDSGIDDTVGVELSERSYEAPSSGTTEQVIRFV